jgi:hypothetical protein
LAKLAPGFVCKFRPKLIHVIGPQEKMFENKKYLSSSERADMAKLLNVTEQQVRRISRLIPLDLNYLGGKIRHVLSFNNSVLNFQTFLLLQW